MDSTKNQLRVVYFILWACAAALNFDSALLPKMVSTQLHVDPTRLGLSVGFVHGIYSFAQVAAAWLLGHISDTHGRKPLLVFGLLCSGIGTACFGFSTSFLMAATIRGLVGLTNNSLSISKAVISDLTLGMSEADRACAFSLAGAFFSLARAMSASLSGFAVSIPALSESYPFAIPCLIFAVPLFGCALCVAVYLRETSPGKAKAEELPVLISSEEEEEAAALVAPSRLSFKARMKILRTNPTLMRLLQLYSLAQFGNGGLVSSLVLFSALARNAGGLALSPSHIGVVFGFFGIVAFTYQRLFFKRVQARLGTRRTFMWSGCASLIVACVFFPVSNLYLRFVGDWIGTTALLILAAGTAGIGFMALCPCVSAMQSNVSDSAIYGLVQGTSSSCGSMLRGVAPLVLGIAFDLVAPSGLTFVPFLLLGCSYSVCFYLGSTLPAEVEVVAGKSGTSEAVVELAKLSAEEEEAEEEDSVPGEEEGMEVRIDSSETESETENLLK